ncbi:MAG: hypothetical protein RJA22_2967 [Verrucomicrobiota bacterium]|jgi:putative membrane-bound dehydrogenase-like protein
MTTRFLPVLFSSLALLGLGCLFANAADAPAAPAPKPRPVHPHGPEAAAAGVARMTAAEGLEVTLFASEPMVVNPADIDIDARGRVWVCEGANYRLTMHKDWGVIRPDGDRILILEDTNGDGAADKTTVFYQDMTVNTALGICVLGNKVIVSASPYVFVLTDRDGDDRADQRELLFMDTSRGDHDHCTHAFVFGPDGKLYFNFGNEVRELRRPKGGVAALPLHGKPEGVETETVVDRAGNPVKTNGKPYRQGMAFRCNVDGSDVESIGWNFRNNYELAVDSFGTVWQSDNDDDGNRGVRINYVMEFGNYGYTDELTGAGWGAGWKKAQARGVKDDQKSPYHWYQQDPGVIPNLLHTGNGSPTGIAVYEGSLLPPVFHNQILHCDAGPRVVRGYPVTPDGAGYRATMTNLLTSPDSWYRPSDVCVAPDGSVLVADWHDAGVGGHNMADRVLATMTGRIYRVAPKGAKYGRPAPDLGTAAGCVAALQSPNLATRYLGWTGLRSLGAAAEPALVGLWKGSDARMRARALQLLARLPGREKAYVEAASQDKDADIRCLALRIARQHRPPELVARLEVGSLEAEGDVPAGQLKPAGAGKGGRPAKGAIDLTALVRQLSSDASPAVRRECAIALRHLDSPEVPQIWAGLASRHQAGDRWSLEALGLAADRRENECFEAWWNAVRGRWDTPAGREIVWRSRSTKVPPLVVKIVTGKGTSAEERERFLRALDFIKGPEKDAALAEIAAEALN